MLIRFVIDNVLSFGRETEFNMLPQPRLRALANHRYKTQPGVDLLRFAAIYGANGAGKSNFVKALEWLQTLVISGDVPSIIETSKFKFPTSQDKEGQYLAIEFIAFNIPLFYQVEIREGKIASEELSKSGLAKTSDENIFSRKLDAGGKQRITFGTGENASLQGLADVLSEHSVLLPNQCLLTWLAKRSNSSDHFLSKIAAEWFSRTLLIVHANAMAAGLPSFLKHSPHFAFASDLLRSFDVGIDQVMLKTQPLNSAIDLGGEQTYEELKNRLGNMQQKVVSVSDPVRGTIDVVLENDEVKLNWVETTHTTFAGKSANFQYGEESDGTKRLMQFVPLLHEFLKMERVCVVDEFELSLHPMLAKQIIAKCSQDTHSRSQLIFTTHESELLDQSILRQDEIWFAEKDPLGATELYSLSDYRKEHNTIDIRKGYLQGRYGGVPILMKFQDFKPSDYATPQH